MQSEPAKTRVLFLCVANAARSAMAEALAPGILGARVIASSAGLRPTSSVHPYAVEVLREVGVDLSHHVPRAADEVAADDVDLVVTLSREDVRPPHLREKPWRSHPISDPAMHAMEFSRAMALETFRAAREDVEDALRDLERELAESRSLR